MKQDYLIMKLLICCLLTIVIHGHVIAQERVVSGKVTAFEDNEALPGVNILLKGGEKGVVSDIEGNFKIEVPDNATLVFSFIGYTTEEVHVGSRSVIDVQMMVDVRSLSEVVVVGYGTQRKSDVTGSVTSVSTKDFNPGQISTPDQLLVGKVAGVSIIPNGGAPGAGSRIRVRGGSSLGASNDPLIVVDGVPLNNTDISGVSDPLSFINPNDIESFTVLKDASATAIYGSRASNGVIIITTKKGEKGRKLKVDFNSISSVHTPMRKVEVLNADEFRTIVNERGNEGQIAMLGGHNTNWQDQVFRDSFSQDNNLTLSGEVKNLPYRVNVGYLYQDGILNTSNMQRQTAGLSLSPQFFDDHLKVNLNMKGAINKSNFADQDAIGAAVRMDPTQPIYQEGSPFGGYFEWVDHEGNLNTNGTRNPVSLLTQNFDEGTVRRSVGNLELDYRFHFLPALRANLNLGYDVSDAEGERFRPVTAGSVYLEGGKINPYSQTKTNKLLDFYFNYAEELKRIDSRIDITAGYSYQDFYENRPSYPEYTAEGDIFRDAPVPFETQVTLLSFFGRLNYSLKDRYLLTATLRQDGSSRFSPETRWGIFPSVAAAWRMTEETFLKNSSVLSDLKLRVGYGVTGQQDISAVPGVNDYPYLPVYTVSDNAARYRLGDHYYNLWRPDGYDRNIKWEETVTYNAGLDFGFLNGRISGTLDAYIRTTNDLLASVAVPAGSNLFNRIVTNVGSLENRGVEAVINFNAVNTGKLYWDFGFNATYNVNKILSLSADGDQSAYYLTGGISGGTDNTVQVNYVGHQASSFYLHKQVYDESGRAIESLYVDRNGDGEINSDDLFINGFADPRVFVGFNSNISYDKFTLSFLLRGSFGNHIYNNIASNSGTLASLARPGYIENMNRDVIGTYFRNYQFLSDYYLERGDFVRMENINLSYNVGTIFKDKGHLRLNATVQNAFVITKYSGLDPEVAGGIDNNIYPRPRVFSIGLNLGI